MTRGCSTKGCRNWVLAVLETLHFINVSDYSIRQVLISHINGCYIVLWKSNLKEQLQIFVDRVVTALSRNRLLMVRVADFLLVPDTWRIRNRLCPIHMSPSVWFHWWIFDRLNRFGINPNEFSWMFDLAFYGIVVLENKKPIKSGCDDAVTEYPFRSVTLTDRPPVFTGWGGAIRPDIRGTIQWLHRKQQKYFTLYAFYFRFSLVLFEISDFIN